MPPLLPLVPDEPLLPLVPDEPLLPASLSLLVHAPPCVEFALPSQEYCVPFTHFEAPQSIDAATPLSDTLQLHAPPLVPPLELPGPPLLLEHATSANAEASATPNVRIITMARF